MTIKLILLLGLLMWFATPSVSQTASDFSVPPKIVQSVDGAFQPAAAPALLAGRSLLKNDSPLSDALARLSKRLGSESAPSAPGKTLPTTPFVLVGLVSEHPALKQLAAEWKPQLPKEGLGNEGYLLDIAPERILLTAAKPAGLFYGITRLLEGQKEGEATKISCARIADWPTMDWRGMHILVNGRNNMPAMERLITEFLPRYRMNQLILEISYNFVYKSHPELASAGGLTLEDCRRLSALGRKNFVRIVPMFNCLGHQSWARTTFKLLTLHPEFDETPDIPLDNPGIYCRSWCPLQPDVNKIIFALFDELIDAFQADAFHVGMDEVFLLGKCSRCKGKDTADLFAKAVTDYHRHLVGKRKVEMMMWADRLLDSKETKYGEWEASANGTPPALQKIPKDIVLCDWHYETPADFPSVKSFQEQGFRVWPSGWNREENVKRLTTCALQNQGAKMMGYLATTWSDANGLVRGLAGEQNLRTQGRRATDLVAAIQLGARIAWEGESKTP